MFTADVKTSFLNASMKDGKVVYARPPPKWQPETLDPSKYTVIWKLQKSLFGLRSVPRRRYGFVSNLLDTCLWTHPSKRVSLVFHVDDSLFAGTCHTVTEILSELKRRRGTQEQRSDDETNALPGTNPGKNEGGVQHRSRCFAPGRHLP